MQAIQRQSPSVAPCAIPVAIYTRVSTLHQVGGRFDSCESQAAICRDHIQRRAAQGWFEAACYSDPAYSGGTMKRPGMEALMRHIAAGGIKIVLIFRRVVGSVLFRSGEDKTPNLDRVLVANQDSEFLSLLWSSCNSCIKARRKVFLRVSADRAPERRARPPQAICDSVP